MESDQEGFVYPYVDATSCIDCGLCERVCPITNQPAGNIPIESAIAFTPDNQIRESSSSGGIFAELAKLVLRNNGVVFGAKYDADWNVVIDWVENKEGLSQLQGSKYVQAQIGDAYNKCKQYLDNRKNVLFSGTPCQIAGLRNYLRKEYDNLLTVEILCHGVPSPKVWQMYLKRLIATLKIDDIKSINFRDKAMGWEQYSFAIQYEQNGTLKTITELADENMYMLAFTMGLTERPSCYDCSFRSVEHRMADITLGDMWGVDKIKPELNDHHGISLVLVNSEYGKYWMNQCEVNKDRMLCKLDQLENGGLYGSRPKHINRTYFFEHLHTYTDINDWINTLLFIGKPSRVNYWKKQVKYVKKFISSIIKQNK